MDFKGKYCHHFPMHTGEDLYVWFYLGKPTGIKLSSALPCVVDTHVAVLGAKTVAPPFAFVRGHLAVKNRTIRRHSPLLQTEGNLDV